MKIVVLSQWYPPEPEPRSHALAKGLVARGHQVTTVTGLPNYPTGKIYSGFRFRPWPQVQLMDGVKVVRVPLFPERSRSVLGRILNYLSFAASAAFYGPLLCGPVDVVWVYHPPLTVALPALTIGTFRNAPFVYEVQDLWPETLAATGMVKSSMLLGAIGAFAKWVYRRAARISVISPGFRRNLIQKGVAPGLIESIPNWADEATYYPCSRDEKLAQELGFQGHFNILYAGNMGPAQDLENVLQAAELCRNVPAIRFVLVGDGVLEQSLKSSARERGISNVIFLPRQSPGSIARLAAISDVMLVHLKRDPLFTLTIPSKTISAMACGRPVLTVSEGDPAETITSAGAGLACPPGEPEALAARAREMCAASAEQRSIWASAARAAFLRDFSTKVLMEKYEALFAAVTAEHRGG